MSVKGIAGLFLLTMSILANAEPEAIQVKAGIPADHPSPGKLVVELKLYGKDLREIKALRCVLDKAVDDTGKNLLLKDSALTKTNQTWTPLLYDPKIPPGLQLRLGLPAPQASKIKEITGRLEILTPVHDATSIVTFTRLDAQLNRELSDPILSADQIKITVSTDKKRGKPRVNVRLTDPLSKLFYFEMLDANGKEWDATPSTTTSGHTTTYTYPGALPENASLRVCVPSPKVIMTVPLTLKDMALPNKSKREKK